jgi:DNA-binding transcriptional MerR regulator
MAKIEDILTLKEAGFSASDIAQLLPLVGNEVKPEVKEEKPVEIPKEEPKAVVKKEEDAINNDISAKLSELIEKIEANALLNTRQKEVEEKSAEDILANIIMPK